MRRLSFCLCLTSSALAGAGLLLAVQTAVSFPEGFSPKSSSDLASWVQAFGSIAAIGAGFLLAYLTEKKRAAEDTRRDYDKMCRAIGCIQSEVRTWWTQAATFFDEMFTSPNDRKMLTQTIAYQIGDSPVFTAFIDQIAALPDERMRAAIFEMQAARIGLGVACGVRNESLASSAAAQQGALPQEKQDRLYWELRKQNDQLKRQVEKVRMLAAEIEEFQIPPFSQRSR